MTITCIQGKKPRTKSFYLTCYSFCVIQQVFCNYEQYVNNYTKGVYLSLSLGQVANVGGTPPLGEGLSPHPLGGFQPLEFFPNLSPYGGLPKKGGGKVYHWWVLFDNFIQQAIVQILPLPIFSAFLSQFMGWVSGKGSLEGSGSSCGFFPHSVKSQSTEP